MLEETLKDHHVNSRLHTGQPPENQTVCLRALPRHFLHSGKLSAATTSLVRLFQCPTTPLVKKLHLIPNLNSPSQLHAVPLRFYCWSPECLFSAFSAAAPL